MQLVSQGVHIAAGMPRAACTSKSLIMATRLHGYTIMLSAL